LVIFLIFIIYIYSYIFYLIIFINYKIKFLNIILYYLCNSYTASVNDTLKAVRELEGSLKRLKKVKKGGFGISNSSSSLFGGKETMSDEDKIRLQMELDIKQYGEEVNIYIKIIN